MPRQITLTVAEGNDPTVELEVFRAGELLDLAGLTPRMLIKASRSADDADAVVLTLGDGLTLGDSAGVLTAVVPHSAIPVPASLWWRLDVVQIDGEKDTAMYGPLVVQDV